MAAYREFGPEVGPSTATGYGQGLVRVDPLRGGGFVLTWISGDDDRTAYDGDLLARTFDASGTALQAAPVVVRADTAPNLSLPYQHAVAALPNGGFVAAWMDDTVEPESSARDIAYRLFDRFGRPVSEAMRVTDAGLNSEPGLAVFADGRIAIAWSDVDGRAIDVATLTADGSAVLNRTTLTVSEPGAEASRIDYLLTGPTLAELDDGRLAMAFEVGAKVGQRIGMAFIDAAGNVEGPAILIPTDAGTIARNVRLGVGGDGLIALWAEGPYGGPVVLRAQRLDDAGAVLGDGIRITGAEVGFASIVGLDAGGFAIAYTGAERNAFVQILGAAGEKVGSAVLVNDDPATSFGSLPVVESLPGEGFVVAWDNGLAGPRAQMFSTRIIGGAGADALTGTARDDVFRGLAGDDRIDGGAGYDVAEFGAFFRQAAVARAGAVTTVRSAEGSDDLTTVERFEFADGRFVLDADSDGARVQRLYDAVLRRGPDQVGLEYWLDQMNDGGQTLSQVGFAFLNSPEFQAAGANVAGNGAYVDFLYGRTLGRAADAGGRAYWVGQLDSGLSRGDALINFSESPEHRQRAASITDTGYFETDDAYQTVALLYDAFANRTADTGGLTYWAEQFKTGARDLFEIADQFAGSAEFQGRTAGLSNAQLVDHMYQNTLGRAPDAAGRSYWTGRLDAGLTDGGLLYEFAFTPEHEQLMAASIIGGIAVL